MKKQKLLKKTFIIMVIALLLCLNGKVYAQPQSGDWKATTAFGEFIFTVNSAGTHITKITFTLVNYKCGPITQSGSMSISWSGSGVPITNNQFIIEDTENTYWGPIKTTINGTFTQTGDQASGTWSKNVFGTICSGSWGPIGSLVSIKEIVNSMFLLAQNYPNPFNPLTTINFQVVKSAPITLKIYDTIGREVRTLVDGFYDAGNYSTTWDGLNNNGQKVNAGIYFYCMESMDFKEVKKALLFEYK
ncbi:MAG TPA: hypothetical protein DCR40_20125 [Prolixibacteraceae bacterium]|nr:hypothetical protein [Prolixibacteraceae bacterium]